MAFFCDKIHGAKFFNIEFRGVNFLLKIKTLKINTIKLVYSLSRDGICRLNLDRGISQWMPTQDLLDFWPRIICNLDLHAKTNSESIKTAIKRRRLRWFGHVSRIALYTISQAKRMDSARQKKARQT